MTACVLVLAGCSAGTHDAQVAGQSGGLGARLAPDPASAVMGIQVVLDDPMIDPAACQLEWRRNGRVIEDAAGATLDPSRFSKGDLIAVAVRVPGAPGGNGRSARAEVRVRNTPPQLTRALLVMGATGEGAQLQASAESVDPDRDPTTYAYRWFRNDQPMEGVSGATLPATAIGPGDRIVVEIVANDGESDSPPMRSEAVSLGNQPPRFASQPIAPKPQDREFRYEARATDPDGDELRYELVSGPSGLTVSPAGTVSWMLPLDPAARSGHVVRLRAVDSKGGEATQEFTIQVAAKPVAK